MKKLLLIFGCFVALPCAQIIAQDSLFDKSGRFLSIKKIKAAQDTVPADTVVNIPAYTLDNTDKAMVYIGKWINEKVKEPNFIDSTIVHAADSGSLVTCKFNGVSIDVFMQMKSGFGKAAIQIDDNPPTEFDYGMASPPGWLGSQDALTVNNLSPGIHTFKLTVLENKKIVFDGIKINTNY